jgi:CubicO group peptidase (beta-lactamase class C family)
MRDMSAAANAAVRAYLEGLVADGSQLGFQLAAYLHGELVVDAWAGVADRATGRPVDGDTLFTVFSVGKGIVATCVHLLAERGRLDYDAPVARYWPAFGAKGKERITVRHALTHQAGLPQPPAGTAISDLADWEKMCAGIADLAPMWEPGTQTGYHAYTFGWIVGEVIRRIDGRSIGQFVQEEICAPLGTQDFYFGIPDAVEPRVAVYELSQQEQMAPRPAADSLLERAFPYAWRDQQNRPDLRRAAIPALGIGTARAVARHYAALIGDGVDGVRLLPPDRVRIATALQTDAPDAVLSGTPRKALGYMLGGTANSPMGTRPTAFGHHGYGGSQGFADPEVGLALGLSKTTAGGVPGRNIVRRVRAALGVPD